jgi:hypothetical protein
MQVQEFYELIEKHRLESVDKLVKKYRTISPLLGKIEEVGVGQRDGSGFKSKITQNRGQACKDTRLALDSRQHST